MTRARPSTPSHWLRRSALAVVAALSSSACYEGLGGREPIAGTGEGVGESTGGGPTGGESTGGEGESLAPVAATLHRLTQPQLRNSYAALLGAPLELPTDLPPDDLLYGFTSIAASGQTISSLDAEKYETATYLVLDQVFGDVVRRDAWVGCAPTDLAAPCIREFLTTFTRRAWRRTPDADEIDALLGIATQIAADLGDAPQGLKYALAAVLQSPHFLFRVEIGEPDPDRPGLLRFTADEMASRLSYLLWNAPPDDTLLAAAERGDLLDADLVRTQAIRMLEDPRARPALVGFFTDFMSLRKLDQLDKDPGVFPLFSATLGPAMRAELERMFENIVFDADTDFREVLTTRSTFLNEELAAVYGIDGIVGPELRPYTFGPESPRAGMFTTAAFLAANAYKTQTSPTHRGRFIRINMLCMDVPPPPAGIDTTLPEGDPTQPQTLRQRLDAHRSNPSCAGCHTLMDPLGFTFEGFDALGQHRVVDELGLPIDTTSDIEGVAVTGAVDAAAAIAGLPEVSACIARRFYEHAGGHLAGPGEEVAVSEIIENFAANDYDFKNLVVDLVHNDGFRYASTNEADE